MSRERPGSSRSAAARALALLGCGPRGCLGTLLVLAVGIVLLVGLEWGMRTIFEPWSVPLGGRPTLTGDWSGSLRTVSGMRFGLGLRIVYHERQGRSGGTSRINLEGSGQLCNRRGDRYDYTLTGATESWDGSSSRLTMGSVDTSVNGSGWGFQLRWEGDRLTLTGINDSFELDERPIGGRTHLITLDPFVGELKRAPLRELDTICRGLLGMGR